MCMTCGDTIPVSFTPIHRMVLIMTFPSPCEGTNHDTLAFEVDEAIYPRRGSWEPSQTIQHLSGNSTLLPQKKFPFHPPNNPFELQGEGISVKFVFLVGKFNTNPRILCGTTTQAILLALQVLPGKHLKCTDSLWHSDYTTTTHRIR